MTNLHKRYKSASTIRDMQTLSSEFPIARELVRADLIYRKTHRIGVLCELLSKLAAFNDRPLLGEVVRDTTFLYRTIERVGNNNKQMKTEYDGK